MNKKKVLTVTCHCPYNYGAVLQAYALQKHLLNQGLDSEIIDYRPKYLTGVQSLLYIGGVKYKKNILIKTLYIIYFLKLRIKTKYNFKRFIKKNIKLTSKLYTNYNDINNDKPFANYYICGSDQIWNTELPNGLDKTYYLAFENDKNKKISYAASFAIKNIRNKEHFEFVKSNIETISNISVRESEAIDIIKDITNSKVYHVLDPVLLLEKKNWIKLKSKINIKFKYLLIYRMGEDISIYTIALKIADHLNLKIVEISNYPHKNKIVHKNYSGVSPNKFLGLFYNADYVVTNSFHGTAFSLIFEKNFTCTYINRTNSRISSLLNKLNISHIQVDAKSEMIDIKANINYDCVNNILLQERENSKTFLKNSLQLN